MDYRLSDDLKKHIESLGIIKQIMLKQVEAKKEIQLLYGKTQGSFDEWNQSKTVCKELSELSESMKKELTELTELTNVVEDMKNEITLKNSEICSLKDLNVILQIDAAKELQEQKEVFQKHLQEMRQSLDSELCELRIKLNNSEQYLVKMIEEKNNFARDKKNIIEEKLNMEKEINSLKSKLIILEYQVENSVQTNNFPKAKFSFIGINDVKTDVLQNKINHLALSEGIITNSKNIHHELHSPTKEYIQSQTLISNKNNKISEENLNDLNNKSDEEMDNFENKPKSNFKIFSTNNIPQPSTSGIKSVGKCKPQLNIVTKSTSRNIKKKTDLNWLQPLEGSTKKIKIDEFDFDSYIDKYFNV